jgi:cAMP-dependent protein kinase regulator
LDQARSEIRHLRKVARDFQNQLKGPLRLPSPFPPLLSFPLPPSHGLTLDELMKQQNPANAVKGNAKRQAVLDKGENNENYTGDYTPKVIQKTSDIRDLIMSVVTTNILFSSYASDEHAAIVDAFESVSVTAETKVITQGESGDYFYVIQNGIFDIFIRGTQGEQKVGNSLGPGNSFGELALMYNTPRAATVKAASNATVWQIDRATFRKIIVHYKFLRNQQYKEFLRNVEINGKKLSVLLSECKLASLSVS